MGALFLPLQPVLKGRIHCIFISLFDFIPNADEREPWCLSKPRYSMGATSMLPEVLVCLPGGTGMAEVGLLSMESSRTLWITVTLQSSHFLRKGVVRMSMVAHRVWEL